MLECVSETSFQRYQLSLVGFHQLFDNPSIEAVEPYPYLNPLRDHTAEITRVFIRLEVRILQPSLVSSYMVCLDASPLQRQLLLRTDGEAHYPLNFVVTHRPIPEADFVISRGK